MSASLTISSASVASDGKTVTVNIGGSTGSLTPTSAVTGFRVRAGSNTLTQASATISGTVLTIVLAAFAGSGQTVQIDTIAGNLADGAANTMVLTNNQAVTNGSAKTAAFFALTDANVVYVGSRTLGTNFGRNQWDPYTVGGPGLFTIDFLFTGTDLAMAGYAYTGGNWMVSIDGGAEYTVTSAGTSVVASTSWSELALATGLADTTHRAQIWGPNNAKPFYVLDRDAGIKVAGSSPSLTAPTSGNTAIKPMSTVYPIKSATLGDNSAFLVFDDNWSSGTEVYNRVTGRSTASLRLKGAFTELRVLARRAGKWSLDVDGTAHSVAMTPSPTDLAATWITIATGLDGTGSHDYRLTSLSDNNVIFAVMTLGGTGLSTSTLRGNQTIAWYGDSISVGFGCTDPTYAHSYLSPLWSGKDTSIQGVAGSFVIGSSSPSGASAARIAGITGLPSIERVVILYGTNDAQAYYNSGGTPNATYSPANFYTAYRSMLDGLSANGTNNVKLDCWGILIPGWSAPIDALVASSFNPQIQAAVADFKTTYPAKAANIRYVDTTGFHTIGGVHPDNAESIVIANHWTPFIGSPGYTLTGPSTGTTGIASAPFTVATNGGIFNGTEAITLSDGGGGGLFTPSVGSPGTGTVTVTPANNAASFTFTYNPATPGVRTLSASNNATLIDPIAATLTAASAATAFAMFFAA